MTPSFLIYKMGTLTLVLSPSQDCCKSQGGIRYADTFCKQEGSGYMLCVLRCSIMSDSVWPMDYSPPGSSVHGILQARILEWVAMSFSKGLPDQESSCVSCWSYIAGQFFYLWPTREDHFPCLSVKFLLTMIICLCHMPYIYLFTSSTHI